MAQIGNFVMGGSFKRFILPTALFFGGGFTVQAQLASGTILVLDKGDPANGQSPILYAIDSSKNIRQLTDFGNTGQAQSKDSNGNPVLGVEPVSVSAANTLLGSTVILVADDAAGTGQQGVVFKVDPVSGDYSVLSDGGKNAPLSQEPVGVKVLPAGLLNLGAAAWLVDDDAGDGESGAVFNLDAGLGTRTMLSDGGNTTKGKQMSDPLAIDVLTVGGPVYILDDGTEAAEAKGVLWSVNPSGQRVQVVDFGNPAGALSRDSNGQPVLGVDPVSLAMSAGLVLDDGAGTAVTDPESGQSVTSSALFKVNPNNGQFTRILDFGNPAQGPSGVELANPLAVTAASNGSNVTVLDENGSLYTVSPTANGTYKWSVLTELPNPFEPTALAIVQ
ncbi:MAG TPA: hypothetical protein VK638_34335 [Edaphobacter sp.]|nr:hypothetical protein [Edaphobacter sp.]